MRRREFIGLAAGMSIAWPLVLRAQQQAGPVIGFLHSASAQGAARVVAAFGQGLNEAGRFEGRNIAMEYRWAEGRYEQLPKLAADLVRIRPAIIFASGGAVSPLAAKNATVKIPIVFVTGSDPVKVGLVGSFNRPGGNVTGVSFFAGILEAKRLELLRQLLPEAAVIGVLVNPNMPTAEYRLPDMQSAASALGVRLSVVGAGTLNQLAPAFADLARQQVDALLISADPMFFSLQSEIVRLAANHEIPAIYTWREGALDGGLMSYGTSVTQAYHLAAAYVDRILKGEKPADLPVEQSTRVELVINLKTAKALGLTVPPSLLARADEVIE
jgi:putative ABC transport system substrate-binding protein